MYPWIPAYDESNMNMFVSFSNDNKVCVFHPVDASNFVKVFSQRTWKGLCALGRPQGVTAVLNQFDGIRQLEGRG